MIATTLPKVPRLLSGGTEISTALSRELDSIVSTLSAKFSGLAPDDVRAVVEATYHRLESAAKIRTHLIPLTVNCARALLENESAERVLDESSVPT